MKYYKKMIIEVDQEIVDEMVANNAENFRGDVNENDKDQTYVFRYPIDKENYMIHEGKIVYGNGLVVLDPANTFADAPGLFRSGDLIMDFITGDFYKKNKKLKLPYAQQIILEMLVRNPKRIITREQIMMTLESVSKKSIADNTVSVYVSRLRKVLGKYHGISYIKTSNRFGYRWNHDIR